MRNLLRRPRLIAPFVALVGLLVFAPSAFAGQIDITCGHAKYTYEQLPTGSPTTVQEKVTIDGKPVASKTVTFNGSSSSGSDTVTFQVPTDGRPHTVVATAGSNGSTWFSNSATLTCKPPPPPPCPSGSKANFQWHYSYNGSSGSWSATTTQTCPSSFSMGPQAMEGNQTLVPGATIYAGYQFTVPGNNSTFPLTVNNPKVTFPVVCANGAAPSAKTFSVTMATTTFTVTGSGWIPGTNGYQGSAKVPNDCGGADLLLGQGGSPGGGTFTARLS